ncbi:MAG: N-6 DNA methylase [Oscillospiraceae bacterium]|nr:N-6 DNA methylase [Oscillospiraceae bacterium]
MLTWDIIQSNAVAFSKKWKAIDGKERQQAQSFVREFLGVFGIDDPLQSGESEFEYTIKGNYIDYLWKKQIAIEMKSKGKDNDLKKAFVQTREKYMPHLSDDEFPDLWMLCDFENIHITRHSTKETFKFKTADLRKHIKKFANIAGYVTERIREDQLELNVRAAEKMAKLHDELESHGYEGNDLEVYLVRLLFCMFAGDTGIFPQDNFYHYIKNSKDDGSDLSHRISDLFEVLNMPDEIRAKKKLLSDELKAFRYINGKLFETRLPPADFNAKTRKLLLECREFNWSEISPAIFGAMFQGVMDKTKRRELGAHYTSEENILKLINPLFLDELYKEFERVKTDPIALDRFHDKIAKLKFLDPACGCGNFLIITYRELRLLELEILKMKQNSGQLQLDMHMENLLKVSVEQFYGIELDDFACQIATVGMWLVDHQMNLKTSDLIVSYYARLPLTRSATIVNGNALRIDWESVVSKLQLSYILGNPPFVGYSYQSDEQKEDVALLTKNKNLDYVTMWYIKSADYIKDTCIKCAFVSTNSVSQGEQVAILWKPLMKSGIYINFGIPTFKWSNEAKGKAAVHCVIVGFSYVKSENDLNPYLVKAPVVFIEKRRKPLCNILEMQKGNMPNDNKGLLSNYSTAQKHEIIKNHPETKKWFRKFLGADEFINNIDRWCLWLKDVSPAEIQKSAFMKDILAKVRDCRAKSNRQATRELAETPYLFGEIRQPITPYLLIPETSSQRRKYIPIDILSANVIVSNATFFVSQADLYHFGILTSSVHMAWMRTVCGRLKSDYRYSATLVYNNFPWAKVSDSQKSAIEKLAQAVLNARAESPNCSLADLYDPLTMPPELLKAHKALDKAVLKLYGFSANASEAEIVAGLMERYQKLVEG